MKQLKVYDDDHADIKALAAGSRKTIQDFMRDLIKAFVKGSKK